jgi:CubicO group peptidase (beta-lactamase class C family)
VKEENWVRTFLAQNIAHQPGTQFMYNSAATYMCSAIVQKVTGQTMLDYLTPRLFEPLGISGMRWETCPRGINTGGWGLSIQSEGLAKFGQLLLQKGKWNGKQLLPAAWIEEATRFHIQQPGGTNRTAPRRRTTGCKATATSSGAARAPRSVAMAPSVSSPSFCQSRTR